MKKTLLLLLLLPVFANAQIFNGPATDSTTFTFASGDSLIHYMPAHAATMKIDTSGSAPWQIGNTLKPVFSNTVTPSRGIMIDTLLHYPKNANSYFVLKMFVPICIISFWHKYQTDSLHAGGLVEFSTDSATWLNVATCPGITTKNFYSVTDTLLTGKPAFMGNSNGEQLSQFQLMNCVGVKTTATNCYPYYNHPGAPIYIRFRFISDSTTDSLSGWMIDSIRIASTICSGGVSKITTENSISIFPNPAYSVLTIASPEVITNIIITNLIGETVYTHEYNTEKVEVNIVNLPVGVYFIKINNTEVRKFVKQ